MTPFRGTGGWGPPPPPACIATCVTSDAASEPHPEIDTSIAEWHDARAPAARHSMRAPSPDATVPPGWHFEAVCMSRCVAKRRRGPAWPP
eukprot:gene17322-21433_t